MPAARTTPSHPSRRIAATAITVLSIGAVLAGCGSDPSGVGSPAGYTPPAEDGAAPEVRAPANDDWPAPGRDLRNSRAVVDSPINAATIDALEQVWAVELPGAGAYGNAASGPIVIDDTVIVQDLTSTVRAIDLETGEVRWTRPYEFFNVGPNGPAVGYDKVFISKGTDEIAALDLATGRELWSTKITQTETDGIDIQPQVFGGLVYASTVPISIEGIYQGGDRGVLHALDVETGEIEWTFDTVKGDDLWGNPSVNSGGGSWFTPSIDEASGTIYWGVANPAPFAGTPEFPNGSSRPGDNLYTDSVVALDAATGELRWYQQAVPHDLFDRDLVHTLVVEAEGKEVVVGTGKLARVIGHDPATGEVLWDTPVGFHQNDELTELEGPTEIAPGTYGGVLTPPAAADGVVYVSVLNAPFTLSPDVTSYLGSELGQMPGEVDAVDASNGELLWSTEIDGDPIGGTIVLGDLVLTGTATGLLVALDHETGEQVWSMQAPGGLNGWPAASGDTLLWPIGLADPPQLIALRLPDA